MQYFKYIYVYKHIHTNRQIKICIDNRPTDNFTNVNAQEGLLLCSISTEANQTKVFYCASNNPYTCNRNDALSELLNEKEVSHKTGRQESDCGHNVLS